MASDSLKPCISTVIAPPRKRWTVPERAAISTLEHRPEVPLHGDTEPA